MYAISPQLLTQEATSTGHFYVEIWLLSWPLLQEQWKFRIKCYIAPLQVLGTRLVQADSYPTWFENVAVVMVMVVVVVGGREGQADFLLPRRSLAGLLEHFPLLAVAAATCTTPGWSAEEDLLSHRKIGS